MSEGVVIVAYGERARLQAGYNLAALRNSGEARPVLVVGDEIVRGARYIFVQQNDPGGRLAKLSLDLLVPFSAFCYLDADTRPAVKLDVGFDALRDGFDLVICPSSAEEFLWRVGEAERDETAALYQTTALTVLQGGVWWARKSPDVARFFAAWREEWARYRDQDQGALLRALHRVPLKVWLLSRDWNGGRLIAHLHGQARALQ